MPRDRDRLRVNHTSHCALCSPEVRVMVRVHVGDEHSPGPRIAVCPVHDVAGPLEALPTEMRRAVACHAEDISRRDRDRRR